MPVLAVGYRSQPGPRSTGPLRTGTHRAEAAGPIALLAVGETLNSRCMSLRSARLRVVPLVLAVGLFAGGCGDSGDDSGPAVTSATTAAPPTSVALDYTVARPEAYLGRSTDASEHDFYMTFQEPDGGRYWHPWGPWPEAEDGSWTLALFRTMPDTESGRTRTDGDLVWLIDNTSNTVVDALSISGPSAGRHVWIGLSCEGTNPVVLTDQAKRAVQAWKVSPDSLEFVELETSELTSDEIASACVQRP